MRKTNTMAIVSLVAGLVGWFMLPVVASIIAVITGHMARAQIRASHGAEDGDGMAIAGLILGYVSLLLGVIGVILTILVFAGIIGLGVFAGMQ